MFGDTLTHKVLIQRKIDAQKYLLSVAQKYKIPEVEKQEIKDMLKHYEDLLQENEMRG